MSDPRPGDGYTVMSDERLMELYDAARYDLGRTMARYAASGVPVRATREAGDRMEYLTKEVREITAEMDRRGLASPRWIPSTHDLKTAARQSYTPKVVSSPSPVGDDEEDGTAI